MFTFGVKTPNYLMTKCETEATLTLSQRRHYVLPSRLPQNAWITRLHFLLMNGGEMQLKGEKGSHSARCARWRPICHTGWCSTDSDKSPRVDSVSKRHENGLKTVLICRKLVSSKDGKHATFPPLASWLFFYHFFFYVCILQCSSRCNWMWLPR